MTNVAKCKLCKRAPELFFSSWLCARCGTRGPASDTPGVGWNALHASPLECPEVDAVRVRIPVEFTPQGAMQIYWIREADGSIATSSSSTRADAYITTDIALPKPAEFIGESECPNG